MKTKSRFGKIICLLVFLFVGGAPSILFSQITVENNSACPLYVQVAQWGASCDMCSSSGLILLPAGESETFDANVACNPEHWAGVHFAPATPIGVGPFGSVPNPIQPNGCQASFNIPSECIGSIAGTWVGPGGAGPQTVTIQ